MLQKHADYSRNFKTIERESGVFLVVGVKRCVVRCKDNASIFLLEDSQIPCVGSNVIRKRMQTRYNRYMPLFRAMKFVSVIASIPLVIAPLTVFAATMTSPSYQIPWDTMSSGGGEQATSPSYSMDDTIGGTVIGSGNSGSYSTMAGYRLGDEQTLSFFVRMAPVSGASVAYASINISGKLVTLPPGVTNPFHEGDFIAVVEDPGLSQRVVIGQVLTVAGQTITVDRFDGQTAEMSPTPTSGVVRLLSGGDLAFGLPSVTTGAVATGMLSVSAPTPSGYTLYGQASGLLASSGHAMTPVADGVVSAGTEEYGMITLGSTAALVNEVAPSTIPVSVQQSTGLTAEGGDRDVFLYKLAISSTTPSGSYGQSVYFTLTPNY